MYLVVRKYRKYEGKKEELTQRITAGFLPLIQKIEGFVDYYCVFSKDGSLLSVSVFENESGARESGPMAAQWVSQNMGAFLKEKPESFFGEVGIHRSRAEKAGKKVA